jgi:AMP-polyphosphate phosphotransferase
MLHCLCLQAVSKHHSGVARLQSSVHLRLGRKASFATVCSQPNNRKSVMLESIDLATKADKATYTKDLPQLGHRLYTLQKASWEARLPVVVAFEGWESRGQTQIVAKLTEWLDPRSFHFHPVRGPRSSERQRPWLWRFWLKLPSHGSLALFSPSWYGRVLVERVGRRISAKEWKRAYGEIVDFERTLTDNGYLVVKFWLHLDEAEVQERFEKIRRHPYKAWDLTSLDRSYQRHYQAYCRAAEDMLAQTDTNNAPWTLLAATDRRHARLRVFTTLIEALEGRLGLQSQAKKTA